MVYLPSQMFSVILEQSIIFDLEIHPSSVVPCNVTEGKKVLSSVLRRRVNVLPV